MMSNDEKIFYKNLSKIRQKSNTAISRMYWLLYTPEEIIANKKLIYSGGIRKVLYWMYRVDVIWYTIAFKKFIEDDEIFAEVFKDYITEKKVVIFN